MLKSMESIKQKELIYSGSFLEAISPILYVSRMLGIFPLKGIRPRPSTNFQFSWFSFATLICLAFMIWDAIVILSHLYAKRNLTISAAIISTNVFHLMGLLIYGVFLLLARRWIRISKWWTEKEQRFLQAPYVTKRSSQLKRRLITVGIVITLLAIAEHSLFQVSDIYVFLRISRECNDTKEFEKLLYRRFDFVHAYIPGIVAMILSQFVSCFATAAWNFLDLFIILISIGITTRFEQLTSALKNHLKHDVPDSKSMLKFRLDFIAICELLEYVDNHMGLIVFLSTANNLFFVCNQLLHASNVLRYLVDYVYYWFSLFYLILRTLYLFLSAAAINESARGPTTLLHNIPQEHWNVESNRLLFHINSSTIALSAMGFFNFTRGIILTMAGAIVTFELVMMQFGSTDNSLKPLCSF